MIAALTSRTTLLRRSRCRSGSEGPQADDDRSLKTRETILMRKRVKVAVFAILFGLISAVLDAPLPLEDGFRAARAQLRTRAAPQDIVMIGIDDATLNELAVAEPSRKQDSELIERLVAAGVSKIVFDRAHADPETRCGALPIRGAVPNAEIGRV